jgi:hypothetical protein
MSNMRKMLEEPSGTHRIALPAMSALAVIISLYIFSASFFPAHEKSFAADLNSMSNSQRCGDDINFFFNDRSGKNIDPVTFESIMIVLNDSDPGYKRNTERKGMKGFSVQTGCGYRVMKVTIAYQNKKMELILKQIPGDQGNIFLYAIPFSKGTYTFDFERNLDKSCEDNVKGWHGECTISPKRLKKISPDSRKQGVTKNTPGTL